MAIRDYMKEDTYPTASISSRIYLEDTDAGGVVYHANYLKYMERARTEFIRLYGLNRAYMLNREVIFLVRKMEVSYHHPAYLDDNILATAKIQKMHDYAVRFKQEVLNQKDTKVLCSAYVQVVCVDQKRYKLIKLPLAIKQVNDLNQS